MRKTLLRALAVSAVVLLVGAGTALAIVLRAGNLIVTADGGFTPTTLPKHDFAPITLQGHGKIDTADGAIPPVLEDLIIWFDKHGEVETRGLPTCTPGKLAATTTAQARKLCPGAIIGKGFGKAVVNFPEQGPIPAGSPITIFNAAPKHGNPAVLAHAHLTVPAPTTFVVPIEIEKVHSGRYGFRTVAKIPKIAGGYGTPISGNLTIGRKWTYKGQKLSYANASCPDGRLQAKVELNFNDSTKLNGTLFQACKSKG
jgi:hypothetical protein